ncbi:MAG: hypothetical protein WBD87_08800 [Candidatus Acidiferrales bacterium]
MATQTIPASSAPLQFPKAIQTVTQCELDELIEFQNLRAQLDARISSIEDSLKTRLEAGAAVESGVHVCRLKESFRRNVAWKAVVLRLAEKLGYNPEAYAANVLSHTAPTRSVSVNVH